MKDSHHQHIHIDFSEEQKLKIIMSHYSRFMLQKEVIIIKFVVKNSYQE